MKYILSSLFCLLVIASLYSQSAGTELAFTDQTIYKDDQGNLVSFETFLELTSGHGYEISPVMNDDGSLKEVMILKTAIAPPTTSSSDFGTPKELIDRAPPHFEAIDRNGRMYNSANLIGRVVVLKFWFIACKPCIVEMPELNLLVDHYKNEPVDFLGFSLDTKEQINSFLQRQNFNYTIIPEAKSIAHDYNVFGYPTHLVINKNGKVEAVYMGVNNDIKGKLSLAIDKALSQTAPPPINNRSSNTVVNEEASSILNPQAEEEELQITPNSVIKNEKGERVPFNAFIALMNTNRFELVSKKDDNGNEFILMREVQSSN